MKVAGEPGADFWQVLVDVDVLFEVPASTAGAQLCLLSLELICSFPGSSPSKLPMDARNAPHRAEGALALGLQHKNVISSAGQGLLRDGGTREGPQPWYLCRSKLVLLLPPSWDWCPPVGPTRRAGSRLQLSSV